MANKAAGKIIGTQGYNFGWSGYTTNTFYYAGNYGSVNGTPSRYTAIVKFQTPEFTGSSVGVTFSLVASDFMPSYSSRPIIRWAILTDDTNKANYIVPGEVTNDPNQIVAGEVAFETQGKAQELTVETDKLKNNTTYYLILWSYSTDYSYRVTLYDAKSLGVTLTYNQNQSITSASDVVLGNACSVNWTPVTDNFYYKLEFSMGGWRDTTEVIHPGVTTSYSYTGYVIPMEAAYQIPSDAEGTMAVALYTYSDSGCTEFVSEDTKTFSVTVPDNEDTKPSVDMEVSLVSDLPSNFDGLFIQNLTKVGADISANGQYGASIEGLQMVMGGDAYGDPFVSGLITQTGNVTVTAKATDSRGFIGKAERTIYVIPYAKPALIPADGETDIVCVRCDENGNITDSGTYLKIKAKRSYSPVESNGVQHNFCRIQYRCNGGNWYTILDENASTDELDIIISGVVISTTSAYTIEVCVVDDIGNEATALIIVPSDNVEFHLREGGDGAAFGEYAQEAKVLSVAESWELKVKGKATIGGSLKLESNMASDIPMGGNRVTGLAEPVEDGDATTKGYVDEALKSAGVSQKYVDDAVSKAKTDAVNEAVSTSKDYVDTALAKNNTVRVDVSAGTAFSMDLQEGELCQISYIASSYENADIIMKVNGTAPTLSSYSAVNNTASYPGGQIARSGTSCYANFNGFMRIMDGKLMVWGTDFRGNGVAGMSSHEWDGITAVESVTISVAGAVMYQKL